MQHEIKLPLRQWVSLNQLSGISTGASFEIQNISTPWVTLRESSEQPESNTTTGSVLTSVFFNESTRTVTAGSSEIWAMALQNGAAVIVQEI